MVWSSGKYVFLGFRLHLQPCGPMAKRFMTSLTAQTPRYATSACVSYWSLKCVDLKKLSWSSEFVCVVCVCVVCVVCVWCVCVCGVCCVGCVCVRVRVLLCVWCVHACVCVCVRACVRVLQVLTVPGLDVPMTAMITVLWSWWEISAVYIFFAYAIAYITFVIHL